MALLIAKKFNKANNMKLLYQFESQRIAMGSFYPRNMSDDGSRKRFSLQRTDYNPVCDSGIYCYGPLLDTIQMAHIFPDSKTFVDKKLKFAPGKIIKSFNEMIETNKKPSAEQLRQFVNDNFEEEGTEMEKYDPPDWTPEPEFLKSIKSKTLVNFGKRVNALFKDLSRKIKDDVKVNPHLYSLIYVPNPFMIPGGRFREFYYWDTYWIIKSLLTCGMNETAKGMIGNFLYMVDHFGMVPNGGRVYYAKRSQPPFMNLMIRDYYNTTKDLDFIKANIGTMEKEMNFYEQRRSLMVNVNGKEHKMFVFGTGGAGPRPESYREDVELAEKFETKEDKEEFYYHMKSGAESGWDYSTRWFIDPKGKNQGGLSNIKANFIVPVDLNSLMYVNYKILANFHKILKNDAQRLHFQKKADAMKEAIDEVLWNKEDKMWYDFDFLNFVPRKFFFPSNLYPLWVECYDRDQKFELGKICAQYLQNTGAIYCKGGLPTSLSDSGQQWDFPNAWPPLQHIVVEGLLKTGHPEAYKVAQTIAHRYTIGSLDFCEDEDEVCEMFEKYDAKSGLAGGGGEYDVQTGFGWSNGVLIEFINLFKDDLLKGSSEFEKEFNEQIHLNVDFDNTLGKAMLTQKSANIVPTANDKKNKSHPALDHEKKQRELTRMTPLDNQIKVENLSQFDIE